MVKKDLSIILLVTAGFLLAFLLFSPMQSLADFEEGVGGKLRITFPKNLSVFHILVILTPSYMEREDLFTHPMVQAVRDDFWEFKDHPAVQMTDQIFQNMWYFPFNYLAFYCTNFPEAEMIPEINLPLDYTQNENIKKMMTQYLGLVRRFYKEANFDSFWEMHARDFAAITEKTLHLFQKPASSPLHADTEFLPADIPALIEAFYGSEAHRYYLVPCPFMQNSATHVEVLWKDGKKDFYFLQGGAFFSDSVMNVYFAFHEFGHSFVEPVSAKFSEEIQKLSRLYEPLKEDFRRMGYRTWDRAFNEHLITAGQLHLMRKAFGEQVMLRMKEREAAKGFKMIDLFYDYLKEYDKNRDKYSDLEDFYPNILEKLSRVSSETK